MRNLPTTHTSSGTQQHQVTSQCGLSASRDLGDSLASTSQHHRLVASVQSSVIGITQHRSVSIELERPPGPILIVDDLPLNRVVLSMMVKKAGLPVAFACNGLECVKAFQSQPPGSYCMILMDLHMPCMDGFTATQMLRHKETSLVPAARPSHATGASQPAKRGPCAVPRPQAPPWGRWLDRDTNGCLNLQRIGESRQRPIELCQWDDLEALPAIGKEYQQGYKLVSDRLPKVKQWLHRAAEYRRGIHGRACNNA